MADDLVKEVIAEAIQAGADPADLQNLSLEALILLINSERLKQLQDKTAAELKELKDRQEKVAELHDIIKAINAATNADGELSIQGNDELKALLERAKELGADIPEGKETFNRDEKDRILENIRMTTDDLNVENDMQLQTVSRLTNERYESYQMARSIMKPLQDAKMAHARAARGA